MFGVNPTGQPQRNNRPGASKPGADGREIELRNNGISVQWRYKGFREWFDLISLRDLTGAVGPGGKQGIQGPKGEQGDKGDAGDDGKQGEQGLQGVQGIQGEKGDTGQRGLTGAKGDPGADGLDGKNGKDGREIELRKSATHVQWRYVGESLWKNLVSFDDIRGPQGKPGEKGDKGERGERGFVGATGVPGSQGPRGPQGFTGPAGPKGDKGDTGATGPQGPAGSGAVESIVAGNNIDVDNTDPANPVVSVEALTKADVGLGNVDNTSDADKPVSTAQATAIGVVQSDVDAHEARTDNPHSVTKTQVGLGNADNTSDVNKPISTATQTALDSKADLVAGKVPSSQLPSFVDDVIMVANFAALPGTGEADKIYVTEDTNLTYRWNGSGYTEISQSLALGETSSTAYRGDRGKIAYDHSQTTGNPHSTTKSDIGLGNVDNTSDANKPVSTAQASAIAVVQSDVDTHEADTSNPHSVTKAQVGLGNADNTSDLNKPISTATQTALDAKIDEGTAIAYAIAL